MNGQDLITASWIAIASSFYGTDVLPLDDGSLRVVSLPSWISGGGAVEDSCGFIEDIQAPAEVIWVRFDFSDLDEGESIVPIGSPSLFPAAETEEGNKSWTKRCGTRYGAGQATFQISSNVDGSFDGVIFHPVKFSTREFDLNVDGSEDILDLLEFYANPRDMNGDFRTDIFDLFAISQGVSES